MEWTGGLTQKIVFNGVKKGVTLILKGCHFTAFNRTPLGHDLSYTRFPSPEILLDHAGERLLFIRLDFRSIKELSCTADGQKLSASGLLYLRK